MVKYPLIDKPSLDVAIKKLRRLRLEDVEGRRERPATTVAVALDRAFRGLGSNDGVEYILRHGIRYYLEELRKSQPAQESGEGE